MLTAVGNMKDTLYGTLNANVNQTFSTPASGDVTQTLNGPFAFTLSNGKLTKLDLVSELGKIAKFTGGGVGARQGLHLHLQHERNLRRS